MRIPRTLTIGALALGLAACSSTPTSAPPDPTEGIQRYQITMIEPPDTDGYLAGLQQREPDRTATIPQALLIEAGTTACTIRDDRPFGLEPTPSVIMEGELVELGLPDALAEKIASDVINAADRHLCDVQLVVD
jgi:hypothetical protein